MSYTMNISEREQAIRELGPNGSQLHIGTARKFFQISQNKISVLFDDAISDKQLLELALYHHVRHVVQNSIQKVQGKFDFLKRISSNSSKYFELDFNILGENASTKVFEFNHLSSRDRIIQQVCEFANMDPTSSRSTRHLQSLEELLLNAQLTNAGGKLKDPKSMCQLKVEHENNLICFSAFDPYGTLEIIKFIKKIEAGLVLGLAQSMNFGKGGAGIGSSLIFENCDSLFLGVQPFKKTRVSVTLPLNVTEKIYEGIQRSIHVFSPRPGPL